MTLSQELIELADGFRKRFNKTDKLSIQDMIKLVTPPKYPQIIEPGKMVMKTASADFTRYDINQSCMSNTDLAISMIQKSDCVIILHIFVTSSEYCFFLEQGYHTDQSI